MSRAIVSAAETMRTDPLCEDGIAKIADDSFYSKYHFARAFTENVGCTARRFLAAVRMARAKELLLDTSIGIVDVATAVGYSSTGTFSSRFSRQVGVSPSQWRAARGEVAPISDRRGTCRGTLRGVVEFEPQRYGGPCEIFVGAFSDAIMQGAPVACARLDRPGSFELHGVPVGEWVLNVHARCQERSPGETLRYQELRAAARMTVLSDPSWMTPARLHPEPADITSPPILLGGTLRPTSAPQRPSHMREAHRSDRTQHPVGVAAGVGA